MAERAGTLVEMQLAGTVAVHEILHMIGWLEVSFLGVTVPTAERGFDLGVAHQAVGHLRQVDARYLVGFLEAAMARPARIAGIEATADPGNVGSRSLEIGLVVDGGSQKRRYVAHPEVQGVVEFGHPGGGRRGNLRLIVASLAGLEGREQIVLHFGAGGRVGVASEALDPHAQMQAMWKGRGSRERAPDQHDRR